MKIKLMTLQAPSEEAARCAIAKAVREARLRLIAMAAYVALLGILAGAWLSRATAGATTAGMVFAAAFSLLGAFYTLRLAVRLDNFALFSDMLAAFDEAAEKGER